MVKLTAELIQLSAQYINPVRDRELDLRGYKIPVIENLGATLDQFDCIDLSDNDVRKLDNFPLLKRLKVILMSNNRVCRIGESLEESTPNLESLILTNNHIQELGDIDPLSKLKNLHTLSLLKNPVSTKKHYRLYVVHKLPSIRLLDFRKVRQKFNDKELSLFVSFPSLERDESARLFKGKKGKQLEKEIGKRSKTFVPGENVPGASKEDKPRGPSVADVTAIKNAIKKASTLEEVERLKQMLKAGQIPGKETNRDKGSAGKGSDFEVDEMEVDTAAVNGK